MSALPQHSIDLMFEAMQRIRNILNDAESLGIADACSASLATVSPNASPSIRTIYIAGISDLGVTFFAHRDSGKCRQIAVNPQVALCMHLPEMQQQITLEGVVKTMHPEEADGVWYQRTPESQLLDCAMNQGSLPVNNDLTYGQRDLFLTSNEDGMVPRPQEWEGKLVEPRRVEFCTTNGKQMTSLQRYIQGPDQRWHVVNEQY